MEILILLLVSPAIFAQRYRKHVNPNDEPFLPIHSVYPYNPKLTKRGFDKEIVTVLKPELYAPRTDARDSYTASYAGGLKDSYFPGNGPPSHSSIAPYSPYSSYYGNNPYGVYTNPFMANPYGVNPYTSGGPSPSSHPGYYHQPPYYYPDYYNQQFPYSFPPPDHSGPPGPPWTDNSNSNGEYPSGKSEKSKPSKPKIKENLSSSSNRSANQYVDGNNLIFQNYKDLMTQSSIYKTSNPYHQPEQITDLHFKNLPIPQTTYKVISVGGQLVGPNYPLPSTYARAQLLEQAAAVKSLAKSLGYLFPHQVPRPQGSQGPYSYGPYANTAGQQSPLGHPDQGKFYSTDQNPSTKILEGAEAHIYGSDDRDLPDKESNNQFLTANQDSSSYKLNDSPIYGDRQNNQNIAQTAEYAIGQADKTSETFAQGPAALIKIPSKYQGLPHPQKSGTRVTFQRSQSTYIPPEKIVSAVLEEADSSAVQSYDQQGPLSHNVPYRSDQNYRPDQTQGVISYQNHNPGEGTAQAYSYHQTNTLPFGQASQQQQQQQQQLKTNLEDVNFGAKQGNKGLTYA